MKKRIIAAASAAVMALQLTSCSFKARDLVTVKHDIPVPPQMLFLGDSIPAGYGLDGYNAGNLYNCDSYANILFDRYKTELADKCGHDMVNKSVSGAESDELLELVESGDLDAELDKADAVVVSIGGNDMLGIMLGLLDKLGYDAETGSFDMGNINLLQAASMVTSMDSEVDAALDRFAENIVLIADEINNKTNGELYIQTLYDPLEYFSKFSTVTDFSGEKIGKFNQIIRDNSDGRYTVVDVALDFKGRAAELTNIKNFDIHPNADGHRVIAENIDAAFRKTGFSYTAEEYGEEYITASGYIAIAGAIFAGVCLIVLTAVLILSRKKKK